MKNSDLKKMTVKQLRQTAKDWNVQIPNNLSKPKTLAAMLENEEFLAKLEIENPEIGFWAMNGEKFRIGSNITSISAIKAQVGYFCKFRKVKISDVTITSPNGKRFKASELNNPRAFLKFKFNEYYTNLDKNDAANVATIAVIDEIIKNANSLPINWEKLGSDEESEIMDLFLKTAKNMQSLGLLSDDNMKLIS